MTGRNARWWWGGAVVSTRARAARWWLGMRCGAVRCGDGEGDGGGGEERTVVGESARVDQIIAANWFCADPSESLNI
jgi:hypothetical protein